MQKNERITHIIRKIWSPKKMNNNINGIPNIPTRTLARVLFKSHLLIRFLIPELLKDIQYRNKQN